MAKSDLEIWQGILAGDNKSWGELVCRYQSLVYAVCLRAGLSTSDIAECFQNTWVSLYNHRNKVKEPARLSAWLVTTAKREALRLRRQSAKTIDEDEYLFWHQSAELPDEELEKTERQAQLEISLDALNERCRKILRAFFFAPESKSYEEIARNFGIPVNSLGPIRKRCLERLKAILCDMGFIEERKDEDNTL
jgi:RNA polymerase sigma factor (sigma-70 family)